MGFLDRFRRGERRQRVGGAPSKETVADLEEFMESREGVEAYVEPPTPVYAMSLCLVAADGEHIRRPVKGERQAQQLCREHGVPLYDARIVGYPRRMKEFGKGVRSDRVRLDDLPPLETTSDDASEDEGQAD